MRAFLAGYPMESRIEPETYLLQNDVDIPMEDVSEHLDGFDMEEDESQ